MQRFTPYQDFHRCARTLDDRRLRKQILESLQLEYLELPCSRHRYKSWRSHPVRKLWDDHVEARCTYAIIMCLEYQRRFGEPSHYDEHNLSNIEYFVTLCNMQLGTDYTVRDLLERYEAALHDNIDDYFPDWWYKPDVFASHCSNLYRKDPVYYHVYEKYGDGLPYVWTS